MQEEERTTVYSIRVSSVHHTYLHYSSFLLDQHVQHVHALRSRNGSGQSQARLDSGTYRQALRQPSARPQRVDRIHALGLAPKRRRQVLGDSTAGTVVEVGPDVQRLRVGDKVFGFTWRSQAEKAYQEFVTAEEWLFGKVCRRALCR